MRKLQKVPAPNHKGVRVSSASGERSSCGGNIALDLFIQSREHNYDEDDSPRTNGSTESSDPSASPTLGTSPQSGAHFLNLLLIEDNPPDALLVREAIKMENLPIEIYIATDGQRALEFIQAAEKDPHAPSPHIMLLDLNLPKINGLEVLRILRNRGKFKDLPVLIATSSDSEGDRASAAKLGAGYFRKPVTYDEFLRVGPVIRGFLKANGLL